MKNYSKMKFPELMFELGQALASLKRDLKESRYTKVVKKPASNKRSLKRAKPRIKQVR
jgi:hypothetical protein